MDYKAIVIDLLTKLINCLNFWEQNKEIYINNVIPSWIDSPSNGANKEPEYLNALHDMITKDEWDRLCDHLLAIKEGREPDIKWDEIENNIRLSNEVKAAIEREKIRQKQLEIERLAREAEAARLEAEERERKIQEKKNSFYKELQLVFEDDFLNADEFYELHGEDIISYKEYEDLKLSFVKAWFEMLGSKISNVPDDEQLAAIASTHKSVKLIARAGSGKTSILINRVAFQICHCGIDPNNMLLLAFNKKAVEEMKSRISRFIENSRLNVSLPNVMTFHALANAIVHPDEKLLFDDLDDDDGTGNLALSNRVQSIVGDYVRNQKYLLKIKNLMMEYFRMDWETVLYQGDYLQKDEYLRFRRSLANRSIDGRYVKSFCDKVIANFLFENSLDYKYEKSLKFGYEYISVPFAIEAPGRTIVILPECDYISDEERDEYYHIKSLLSINDRILLIEIPYKAEEKIVETLSTALNNDNVAMRRKTEEEIWQAIKDDTIYEFTKLVTNFIGRCRKNYLSVKGLAELINQYKKHAIMFPLEEEFLLLMYDMYNTYISTLAKEKLEDFDGLMHRAVEIMAEGRTSVVRKNTNFEVENLTHIFIDEYQDFSYLFERLIDEIRKHCPASNVFCVGDDWQAINGFAGADLKYFNSFKDKYDDSVELPLRTNYRSDKLIVDVGNALMSKSDSVGPASRANSNQTGTVLIADISKFNVTAFSSEERRKHGNNPIAAMSARILRKRIVAGKKTVMLSRTKDRLPKPFTGSENTQLNNLRKHERRLLKNEKLIEAFTTHKYKGLESDSVIIIDAFESYYPLIHPTWIFFRIFGDSIDKLVEAERRLFYVALTRAVHNLFIFTDKSKPSPFLVELIKDLKKQRIIIKEIEWSDYPAPIDGEGYTIIVSNSNPSRTNSTYDIRGILKASGFRYNGNERSWTKTVVGEHFDLDVLRNTEWVKESDGVKIVVKNAQGDTAYEYHTSNGRIKDIVIPVRKFR